MARILDVDADIMLLVKELHERMKIGYEFPKLDSELFCVKKLILENEEPVAAGALKLTSEAFLWVEPNRSDYKKSIDIVTLMQYCHDRARLLGLQDITAWVPPEIEASFAGMLQKLGWERSPWASWSTRVK